MKNIYITLNAIIFLTCLLSACSPFKGANEHPATRDFCQQMDKSITQMDHLYTEAGKLLIGNKSGNYDQVLRLMQQHDQQATQALNRIWAFLGKFDYERSPMPKPFATCEDHAQAIGLALETHGAILNYAGTPTGKQEPDYLLTLLEHEKQLLQASRETLSTCSLLPIARLHNRTITG